VAYFHGVTSRPLLIIAPSFNRSSAMWPTSTSNWDDTRVLLWKSFNRSSAMWPTSTLPLQRASRFPPIVSIAQARCGLLPRKGGSLTAFPSMCFNRSSAMWPTSTWAYERRTIVSPAFQSLKRDVAYFHGAYACDPANLQKRFQSLKRDVAYFHRRATTATRRVRPCFNRSSAMWPTST